MAKHKKGKRRISNYSKILPSGTIDPLGITQADYDQVVDFIKKGFSSNRRVQKEMETTLKRTFILGRSDKKNGKISKSFGKIKTPSVYKSRKRRAILRRNFYIPTKLPYEEFSQLNELWKSYIAELIKHDSNPNVIQEKLNRVDFHGAYLKLVESNCKDQEGLEGIVIKESRNTFVIVNKQGFTKTLPKYENIFEVNIESPKICGKMRISGNSLLVKPAERATKKVKGFIEHIGTKLYRSKLRYSMD